MINIIGVLVKGGRYFYRLDLSDGAKQPVELFHQTDAPPNTPRVVARFYNWDAPIEQLGGHKFSRPIFARYCRGNRRGAVRRPQSRKGIAV
jgi:hypothetical protein